MKEAGILLHISSLPGEECIGTLGNSAKKFIDFLVKSNQKHWQILPLGPTIVGDSPYQTTSIYAGNLYFIDLHYLFVQELLKEEEYKETLSYTDKVNYSKLFESKKGILYKAFLRSNHLKPQIEKFKIKNTHWINDYALFSAIKEKFQHQPWNQWPIGLKKREQNALNQFSNQYKENIDFYIFCQYLFYKQWNDIKKYANINKIQIVGDVPIYVAYDSVEVWSKPYLFELDEEFVPINVAGCPPDKFAKKGQLWGNPLYQWDKIKQNNYQWWIDRMRHASEIYDIIRIDHFRGFSKYYAISSKNRTAKNGEWKVGPSFELFEYIKKSLPNLRVIAENLGFLDEDVHNLLRQTKFQGMKVLQFEYFSYRDDNELKNSITANTVLYTGTHDNPTISSWYKSLSRSQKKIVENRQTDIDLTKKNNWYFIDLAYSSNAFLVVVPLQDFLGIEDEGRMNVPSTTYNNWIYRMKWEDLTCELEKAITELATKHQRNK